MPQFFCAFPKLWPIAGDRLVEVRFLASYTDLSGEVATQADRLDADAINSLIQRPNRIASEPDEYEYEYD